MGIDDYDSYGVDVRKTWLFLRMIGRLESGR
jgi:hypothetical protein